MALDKDKDKTIKFYLSLLIAILGFVAVMRYSLVHLNKLKVEYHPPNLSLAKVFTNNMLLQRNRNIVIWGKAHNGKEIKIEFKDKHYKGSSDKNDNWKIGLGKHEAGGPYEIKIKSDKEEIVLGNVLIGDQWLVLGESIINFPLSQTSDFTKEIVAVEKLSKPLRYYNADLLPKGESFKELNQEALWQVVKPETVTNLPAVPYYFAKALSRNASVPVGIIKVAEDYTAIETFLSPEALSLFPEFEAMVADAAGAEAEKEADADDIKMEHHYKALFDTTLNNSSQMLKLTLDKITEGDLTLFINEELIGKINATDNLRAFNIPASLLKSKYNKIELRVTNVNDMVQLSRDHMNLRVYLSAGIKSETVLKPGYLWHYTKFPDITVPGLIFKEMIQPLLGLKFKGIMIYQGDSDLDDPTQYRSLLTALIKDLQTHFIDTNFIFLGLRNINSYNPDFVNASNLKAIQRDVIDSFIDIKFVETSDLEFKTSAEAIAARCL